MKDNKFFEKMSKFMDILVILIIVFFAIKYFTKPCGIGCKCYGVGIQTKATNICVGLVE